MKVFCTRLLLRKFKEVLWGLVEGGMLGLGGGKGGFGTRRLVSSLFVSKHPVLASWNPRVRMKDEVVGDYNLRKLPNCQSPQSRLQPWSCFRSSTFRNFPELQSFSILELDRTTHLKYLSFAGCQISSSSFLRFVKKSDRHGGDFYWSQMVCFVKLLFNVSLLVYYSSPMANLTSKIWSHLTSSSERRMIFWPFCTFLQLLAINSIWSTGVEFGGLTWLMGGPG